MFKNTIKEIANLICLILVFPLYVFHLISGSISNKDSSFWAISGSISNKDSSFWAFSQFLSLLPGTLGSYLRKNFYRLVMTACDKDCAILFGTIFSQVDTEIGKGVYIGPNCNIGRCRIEDHCTLGSNVHVMSGRHQHNFEDLDTPVQEQGGIFEIVTIGEDTWVGNCALIMANVGKKCIVGAGSVLTKDVENYSVVAGNPARVIKKREPRIGTDDHG
jgi:acetyltransferase-like isoleucine patch superfamily enzyme